MMGAPKPRGRRPGTLARFKCCTCGVVNLVSGGSDRYRCWPCRENNVGADLIFRRRRPRGFESWSGKADALGAVARAIRDKRLVHPAGLLCADCGGRAIEYEHRDYNKPLSVEPICRGCNLRRGPAIPRIGYIERVIAEGRVPYTLRRHAQKLLSALGRPVDVLDALPVRLNVEHWRQFWPELIGADGAPKVPALRAQTAPATPTPEAA